LYGTTLSDGEAYEVWGDSPRSKALRDEEERAAAVRIQASFRGHEVRKRNAAGTWGEGAMASSATAGASEDDEAAAAAAAAAAGGESVRKLQASAAAAVKGDVGAGPSSTEDTLVAAAAALELREEGG
jgi:uncharacterized protein with GYD domain